VSSHLGSVQKTEAIVQRFVQLKGHNASFSLFPEQLMDVRTAPHMEDPHRTVPSMAAYFVERVFEVHVHGACPHTGRPAMTLAEFADFLLAWNYRGHPASTRCAFAMHASCSLLRRSAFVQLRTQALCKSVLCEHMLQVHLPQLRLILEPTNARAPQLP
jgi:hypothetical protein